MFGEENKIQGKCCTDCSMVITYDDDSIVSDDWSRESYNDTMSNYRVIVDIEEPIFTGGYCDVCLKNEFGDKYDVEMWEL